MKEQNNIITFNNELFGQVRAITINNESYFIGKDVAEALGYKDTDQAVRKHVDDEDKLSRRIDGSRNMTVINESGVYSLIFGSKLESAKQFKRWVTSEILPTLRKSGVVVLEHAEPEAIDYQAKYGKYRIRKTFTESTDIRATYEEYASLSKIERDAHRIDNKDRIRNCKAILDVIETKIANDITTMRGSEVLALRELALDIQADITKLHNKRNSGIKSAQTKKIQQLEEQAVHEEDDAEYFLINKHPFTNNCLYDYVPGGRTKSVAYRGWINNLHLEEYLPAEYPSLDTTKPMKITLLYGHMPKFDTVNFEKSIIDQVSNYYGFDDKLIKSATQELHSYVDNYQEGYIYLRLENIDDADED